jgi:hypothetical protein
VYEWSYAGGKFDVVLRPHGVFYCSKYPAQATWTMEDNKMLIEWGKFGSYEFPFLGNLDVVDGYGTDNKTNWRKLTYARDFNPIERLLLGDGHGSVWNFEHAKGSFEIEFHVDGYNHFVCKQFPAHSHWLSTDDGLVQIFWGQYGDYELRLDPTTNSLTGHKSGQASNWRKAHFLRALQAYAGSDLPSHDHAHHHTGDCKH